MTWVNDGGVTITDLGQHADAGLVVFWNQSNATCLRQSDFSLLDDCLTHQAQVAVMVVSRQATARFEYYTGSGVLPPLTVERAVDETLRLLHDHARDAGFDF